MSSTAEKVIDIIAEQLGVSKDNINEETNIANDLGADSLDTAELMIAFEEAFEINITEDPGEKIETVGQVIKYIESRLDAEN